MKIPERTSDIVNRIGSLLDPIVEKECPVCEKSCCVHCASQFGHFMFGARMLADIGFVPEVFEKLRAVQQEYGWDNSRGFLGKTGCTLPRTVRSFTCQRSHCDRLKKSLTTEQLSELKELLIQLRRLRIASSQLV